MYTSLFGANRIVHRGGGLLNEDLINRVDFCWNCSTCDMVCGWIETVGVLGFGGPAYYAKCYNASGFVPPNKARIAFSSQSGTPEIDPNLPLMNSNNVSSCWRKFYKHLFILYCSEGFHRGGYLQKKRKIDVFVKISIIAINKNANRK